MKLKMQRRTILFVIMCLFFPISSGIGCEPNPCKNDGICTFTASSNSYTCTCITGFSGEDCDNYNAPTDDIPQFDTLGQPATVYLIEEDKPVGSLILTLSGSDPEGASVTYGIIKQDQSQPNYLSVGPFNGEVRILQKLDAETDIVIGVSFTISDGTNNPTEAPSSIIILDINDNAPQFVNTPYIFTIAEDTPVGYVITTISTTDGDTGITGAEYRILENTSVISVDLVSGEVRLRETLNHEVTKTYQFTIKANDFGTPPLENTTSFILDVLDVQDSLPVFVNKPYTTTVQENAPIGTVVTTVSAVDQDTGVPNMISYSIVEGNEAGLFHIDPTTGNITVIDVIDREMQGFSGIIQLTVMATEVGGNATVKTTFSISVEDVSDQPPTFSKSQYNISISEFAQHGQQLPLQIVVSDADLGTNADFTLRLHGMYSELFSPIPLQATGSTVVNLTLLQSIDYESRQSYSLQIIATDSTTETLSSEASIMINVINENDNTPTFDPSITYFADLYESAEIGYFVIKVNAIDNDLELPGEVTYTLSGSDRFEINSTTGEISVEQQLDYEEKQNYLLTVTAVDGGIPPKSAFKNVTVNVMDVNDNPPQFTRQLYEAHINENEMYSVGKEVTIVRANDPDVSNNYVRYYFLQTFSNGTKETTTSINNFIITTTNDGNGYVYTIDALDFEVTTMNPVVMTVVAEDSAGLQDFSTINVYIADINDNAPIFEQPSYEAIVPENLANGETVLDVSATDNDGSLFGTPSILYSLRQPNSFFTVNAVSGKISSIAALDADGEMHTIVFEVVAMDGGQGLNQMSSFAIVTIAVTDVNDNDPVFEDHLITAYLPENATVGEQVYIVTINDRDQLINNTAVTYSIIDGNDDGLFIIDSLVGNISTTGRLDYETTALFTLTIRAEAISLPVPPATGMAIAIVEIFIQDVNDNAPVFTKEQYNFEVMENLMPDTSIGKVSATDADSILNAEIKYSIISGNENELFTLSSSGGDLILSKHLNREEKASYILFIRAEDFHQPSLHTESTVIITVLDVNDNFPIWIQDSYSVNLTEGSSPALLLQVQATDFDEGKNSDLVYTLNPPHVAFFINDSTGELFTVTEIDREDSSFITLFVHVRDSGDVSQSATNLAEISIMVIDVNDNPPVSLLSEFIFTVNENSPIGTSVGMVQVSDIDSTSSLSFLFINTSTEFTINITSGEITTKTSLDRETISEYSLKSLVNDGKYSIDVAVKIIVMDVNDNAPQFTPEIYNVSVGENAASGALLTEVSASDVDEGDNGLITYSILNGNIGNVFRIDPATGRLYLATTLDRESISTYNLSIQATDGAITADQMTSTAFVMIQILDFNDNKPIFTNDIYTTNIAETVAMGTTIIQVAASDADEGVNAVIAFSIINGNDDAMFMIDGTTGEIVRGINALDFESVSLHSLLVLAANPDGQQSTATVRITVIDVNDEVPLFTQELYQRPDLSENAQVNDVVVVVSATDSDSGDAGVVSYSIVNGNQMDMFGLNPTSGSLSLRRSLDYETNRNYTLTVAATDQSPPNNVGYAKVEIMIVNVNDEVPLFENTVYTAYISENVMIGHLVMQVTAVDGDGQTSVVYSIDANSDARNLFEINPATGEITTIALLDREASSDISFTIFASDGIERGSALFKVILLDVNDNKPMFDVGSQTVAEVMENGPIGSLVVSFIATDKDQIGPNSQILYNFVSGNEDDFFSVSVLTNDWVQINTTSEIDRETKSTFLLNVSASDRGIPSMQNFLLITVLVQDVNDNAPEFTVKEYITASILENSLANKFVVQVQASDADSVGNGDIRYDITEGNPGVFTIDAVSGNITTTYINLDREVQALYNLTVTATDLGNPPMQASTYVIISILDDNDNAPVFEPASQSVTIAEGPSSVGVVVAMMMANDPDFGSNGDVEYSINEGNIDNVFIINSTTGLIKTIKALDREITEQYLLIVTANDQSDKNRQTGTTTLTVEVDDINDVFPTFPSSFVGPIVIPEGRSGEYLGTYTALDADLGLGGSILYSLGNESSDTFSINTITGILSIKGNVVLDYEMKNEYNITILAADMGSPSLVGMMILNVQVMDQNDNSPVFINLPYQVSVAENVSVGANIFQVEAYDIDSEEFQPIKLSILEGNTNGAFIMDEMSGELFVNRSLDSETQSLYELVITATDNFNNLGDSRTTTTTVTITVLDINELPLEFSTLLYYGQVQEGQPSGTLIEMLTAINALDGDTGSSNDITYALLGRGSSFFTIDQKTGIITTSSVLDYEEDASFYFNVQAIQSGGDIAYATINITVTNVNDEVPVFSQDVLNVTIAENAIQGTNVIQLFASDPDGYSLTFKLDSGALDKFTIDSNGIIKVANPLDFEQQQIYNLIVSASDIGVSPQTGYTMVNLYVLDVNDSPPRFTSVISNYVIQENSAAQMLIGTVYAEDDDTNSNISYSIVSITAFDGNSNLISDTSMFQDFVHLESLTGDIYTNEGIDREIAVRLEITVEAEDLETLIVPSTSDPNAVVRIEISDENDNAPMFASPIVTESVTEGPPVGNVILNIMAYDPDADINGQVMYTLLNTTDIIIIDNTTGQVTLNQELDRESTEKLVFLIQASDGGVPTLLGMLQFDLLILDINDNNPVFNETEYHVRISENVIVSTPVLQVKADDIDEGNFGMVEYSLSGGQGKFSIDKMTGQIIVSAPLDRENEAVYTLTVTARDNPSGSANNRRESSTQVIVTVDDVNEFPPLPSMDHYIFDIQENLPASTRIGHIEAIDPDDSQSQLTFSIIDTTYQDFQSLLRINSSTGELFTLVSLDRESLIYPSSITLTVNISDNGVPQMSSQALVDVIISDVNDNNPTFSLSVYYANISEDSSIDNVVARVTAIDADQNSELSYSITSGNINGTFKILSDSGFVITAKNLDFESIRAFSLHIEADDGGGRVGSTILDISVQDVNDHSPVFLNAPYAFFVAENVTIGHEVGKCSAVDSDAGTDSSQVLYSIIGGSKGEFVIDTLSGILQTIALLDRESVAQYNLIIEASNKDGLAKTTQVTITIEDINDVVPHFETLSQSTYQLLESASVGSFVVTVAANDEDAGANGEVAYSIIDGNIGDVFIIDQQSGTISTGKLLYEQNPQIFNFQLVVKAMDGGNNPLSSTIIVDVKITDENNHKPVFVYPVAGQRLTIPENVEARYLIATVLATDGDDGSSSIITYGFDDSRMQDREILEKFIIDPNNGTLLSNTTFDREEQAIYTLILTAKDNGVPRQTTQQEIIIEISDVDDNEPGFAREDPAVYPVQSLSVQEGASDGTYVGTIMAAVDPDEGSNFYYFIVDGNDPVTFSLNKESGELFLIGSVDREATLSITLLIKVSSDPNYTVTSQRKRRSTFNLQTDLSLLQVIVNLEDVNDNGPVFAKDEYIAGIAAEADIRTEVYQMNAEDPDSDKHTSTEYAILATASNKNNAQAEADGTFIIYLDTGLVTLNKQVNQDAYDYFDLTVRAIDTVSGISSLAILKIYVLDPNQRVVIVINAPIEEVKAKEEQLIELLSNITQGIVFIDDILLYTTEDGKVAQDMTSVSINVIDPETNQVMPADLIISRIDQNSDLINALFGIAEVYPLVTNSGGEDWALMEIALIAIAILIFIGTLAFCIIICFLQKNSRKKLSMRDGVSYGNSQNLMDPYDFQGNNPMWLDREDSMSDWPDSISLIDSRQVPYRDGPMDFFSSTNTFDSNHRAKNGTIQQALPPPPPPPTGQSSSNNSEVSSIELLKRELVACGASQEPRAIPIHESGLEDSHNGILTSQRVMEINQILDDLTSPDSQTALSAAAYRSELEYDNQLSTIAEEEASMISSLTDGSSLENRLQSYDLYATLKKPATIQEVTECGDVSSDSTSSSTQATVLSVTTYKLQDVQNGEQVTNGHITELESDSDSENGCKKHTYTINESADGSSDDDESSTHESDKNSDISTTTAKAKTYIYTINGNDESDEDSEEANKRLRIDMGGEVALSDDSSVELMQEISDYNANSGYTNLAFHEEETHL
ncbi:cadherin-23-like [Antedon mediterranea]|uniref:cadherin-23-like n=1 Tax=Antedon mediterranea TaxID=105859 RepID=UPI003AF41B8D